MKIDLNLVTGSWECGCGKKIQWSYADLAEKGDPVCECGEDMQLSDMIGSAPFEAVS